MATWALRLGSAMQAASGMQRRRVKRALTIATGRLTYFGSCSWIGGCIDSGADMTLGRVVAFVVGALLAVSAHGQTSSTTAYQSVVVCLPASAASGVQPVLLSGRPMTCGTDAGGNALMGYVAAWQIVPASASGGGFSAVDPEQTAAFWAGAFGSVLLLFFTGAGIGAVLDVIRRG